MSGHVFRCTVTLLKPTKPPPLRRTGNLHESVTLMLLLFRYFKNLRDREHFLRTRYRSEHPHFFLYLALDAIVTVAIVTGGYAIASTHDVTNRNSSILRELGLISLSAYSFKEEIRDRGIPAYWVGPGEGSRYAATFPNASTVEVKYTSGNSSSAHVVDPMIIVTTYNNPNDHALTTKGPIHAVPNITKLNALGAQITYNPSHLAHVVVNVSGSEKLVLLRFAVPQTESALVAETEKLLLVS